jgi:anti-sigma B factor antagonist
VDLQSSARAGRGCTVVRVSGELDMDTAPALQDFLQAVAEAGAGQVVLDCSELTFLDSSGLGILLVGFKELRERGGRLCLAAVQPPVEYVLRVAAVDQVMDVYDSVAAAEAQMPPAKS